MRKVIRTDAEKFAKENNLLFDETSALHCLNISDVFEKLLEEIYDYRNRLLVENT